jgi:hypothetical protein
MPIRHLVPKTDLERTLGTVLKRWLKGWFRDIFVDGVLTNGSQNASVVDLASAVSLKHGNTLDHSNNLDHSNANDPSAGEKSALAGTSGTPGSGNKYVTDGDVRNSNARTPTSHSHAIADTTGLQTALDGKAASSHNQDASTINAGTLDGDRLPALSSGKKGGVPATGTPSGLFLRDDGSWTSAGAGGGLGYTLGVQALTSSPTDAQTVYFGNLPRAPTTSAAISKIYVRKAMTIKMAEIYCYSGTAGTNESWSLYIRKNNTTDYLIATLGVATNERVFSNAALSIPMAAGDYFEIKGVQPTWGTNPLTTIYGGYVYGE